MSTYLKKTIFPKQNKKSISKCEGQNDKKDYLTDATGNLIGSIRPRGNAKEFNTKHSERLGKKLH